jgi:enediyne biosynthesis protein E4
VKVTAGGVTYMKAYDGNSGYLSHSLYPLYFGLAGAETIDSVEVTWPTGKKQIVASPKINSQIEVKEQ